MLEASTNHALVALEEKDQDEVCRFGHTNQSPAGDLFAGATICRVRSWMSAWVFLLLGGMDSIVFGPIRWCVWSFRLSSPLRLPHLKFLFVFF